MKYEQAKLMADLILFAFLWDVSMLPFAIIFIPATWIGVTVNQVNFDIYLTISLGFATGLGIFTLLKVKHISKHNVKRKRE